MKGLLEISASLRILFWKPLSTSKGLSKSLIIITLALEFGINIEVVSFWKVIVVLSWLPVFKEVIREGFKGYWFGIKIHKDILTLCGFINLVQIR